MYKRVLIPLDGSEAAETAVEEVLKMAPAVDAVHLSVVENPVVNMARLDGYTMYVDQIMQLRREAAQDYLRPFAEMLSRAGMEVNTSVVFGDPVDAVAKKAREMQADLVLLGGKEGGWFWRHTGMAGIATRLARRLEVPVLLTQHVSERTARIAPQVAPKAA